LPFLIQFFWDRFLIGSALLAVALSLAACSSTGGDSSSTSNLSGTIEIDGSSTVFPISEAVAEEFNRVHPNVRVNVGASGTGGGFKRFSVGDTDISDASRTITDSEAKAAGANGIEYLEFHIGMDGLSVIVSPENDFVQCLKVDELNMIWNAASTVSNWNQVRSSFPDRPLRLYGPDTDSGTFDFFTEEVNGEAQVSRADYTASADDNVLVRGIAGDRNALGYFGYAYYAENIDKLKLVAVDNGEGCVTPTPDTILSGEYQPLTRPLFLYINKESLLRPEVMSFAEFYIEHGEELTREVGYVPANSSAYADSLKLIQTSK
jgi:phosphate transport system substrate-binding protein